MSSLKTSLALGSLTLLASACGVAPSQSSVDDDGSTSSFAELLRRGRNAAALPGQAASYADAKSLDGEATVSMEMDAGSGDVAFAAFDTSKMPDAADLKDYALAFVAKHQDVLGVSKDELKEVKNFKVNPTKDAAVLTFVREVSGMIVRDSYLQFGFAKVGGTWRLRDLTNHTFGRLVVKNDGAKSATYGDAASAIGRSDLKEIGRKRVVYTREKGQNAYEMISAQELQLKDPATGEVYTVTVEDGSNKVLEAYTSRRDLAARQIYAHVHERSYFYNKMVDIPLQFATVGSSESDLNGNADVSGESVTVQLSGSTMTLQDSSGRRIPSFTAQFSGDRAVVTARSDAELVPLNAFSAIGRANAFARKYVTTQEVPWLSEQLTVVVNVAGGCNSYYDGTVNLYAESSKCANMSLLNDVAYHEWGHGLDDATGTQGGMTSSAFSEGIGDIVAAYMTNSSNMAPGFYLNKETGIRQLKNSKKYPQDRGEAHAEGTIIGGAFWDLREAMIQRYGQDAGGEKAAKLFVRHLLTADGYTQSYQTVQRLNDDDGNAATKGPDYCLINAAFAAHGLATAENCTDANVPQQPQQPQASADASLYLRIDAMDGSDNVTLWGAAANAASMAVCAGDKDACLKGTASAIEMTKFASTSAGTPVFKAAGTLQAKADLAVTILAKDASGKVTGYRSAHIKPN